MSHNRMKIEFLSKSENESFARVAVAAFVSQLDPTIEEITDIKTAVSEAVTNSIIHGYGNKDGVVTIESEINDGEISIIVEDEGVGISDLELAYATFIYFKTRFRKIRNGLYCYGNIYG
jgi:anti-sigma F factor